MLPFMQGAAGIDNTDPWVDQPGSSVTIDQSMFGMNAYTSSTFTWPPTAYDQITVGVWRAWLAQNGLGTTLQDMNPSKGTYDFTNFDNFLNGLLPGQTMNWTVGGQLPLWMTGTGNAADPPATLQDFLDSCAAVATHIAGHPKRSLVSSITPQNELDVSGFWTGTDAQMAAQCSAFYDTVKAILPEIPITTPTISGLGSGQETRLDTVLSLGVSDKADVFCTNSYYQVGGVTQDADDYATFAATLAAIKAKYPGVASKPTWTLEGGYGHDSVYWGNERQAAFIANWAPVLFWNGYSKAGWYFFNGNYGKSSGVAAGYGTLRDLASGTFTEGGVAYQQNTAWLIGATITAYQRRGRSGRMFLTRPGGYQAERVWHNGAPITYTPTIAATRYRDLNGNTFPYSGGRVAVGRKPLLFETGAPS